MLIFIIDVSPRVGGGEGGGGGRYLTNVGYRGAAEGMKALPCLGHKKT